MPNITLTITVPNLATVLGVYDSVQIFRSTTGIAGEYSQLTDATSAIQLKAGTAQYLFEDPAGEAAFFYRSAYASTAKNLLSVLSDPFGGGEDPVLSVLPIQDLKDRFLFGIDLTDKNGNPIPDAVFVNSIRSAVSRIGGLLDLTLLPTTVLNERKDYVQTDVNQFFWMNLSKRPVQEVTGLRLRVPGGSPLIFPLEWVELQAAEAVVQVVPQSTINFEPSVQYSTPLFTGLLWSASRRRIPNALEVDYVAGYPPGQVPADILDVIGKSAAIGPLRTAGNILLGAGVAGESIGIDGLSQSVSLTKQGNGAFAGMVNDFQNDIAQALPELKAFYGGIRMRVA